MMRFVLTMLFVTLTDVVFAGTIPAIPRVIIPVEEPTPMMDEDPVALAERIAKQAKAVRDKLADADTGPSTREDQKKLKQDIDALIKKLENPPPNDNNAEPPPMGGSGGTPPPPMGGNPPPPMGGGRSGRKPRGEKGAEPPPMGGQSKPMGAEPKPGEPKSPAGNAAPGQAGKATPSLPLEESIARDFWGHLPDAPRQKMLQFYREQYMSKYKDLLPKYYESLAEKDKKAKK